MDIIRKFLLLPTAVLICTAVLLTGCGGYGIQKDNKLEYSAEVPAISLRSAEDQAQLEQDIEDGYLILVNKQNCLAEDYVPADLEGLLYYAADRTADARFLRKTAAEHFHQMAEAAKAENIEIVSTTAYRSYDFQEALYSHYVQTKGQEAADSVSAKPGFSEHQTGLAADLSTGEIGYANGSSFGGTAAGAWVAEHCWEYGFIIRYPEGKEDITGYSYEPWHVRYVGTVAAREIFEKKITLEEYVSKNGITNPDYIKYAG